MLTTLLLIIGLHSTDTIPLQNLYLRNTGTISRMSWDTPRDRWDITKCFPCSPADSTGDNCSFYSFRVYDLDTWVTVCDSSKIVICGDTTRLIRELLKYIDHLNEQEKNRQTPAIEVSYYQKGKLVKLLPDLRSFRMTGPGIRNYITNVNGVDIKTDSIYITTKLK